MINPRYHLLNEPRHEGGFGRIDKAWDRHLERPVAIKTLDPLFQDNPSEKDQERFKREAKILANLSHPNVPAIYDVQFPNGVQGDFKLIVQWIEGITLRDYLSQRGLLSLEQVKKWFANICSALQHAHQKGVVHRDLKPANLIITATEEACYLVDFGISLRQADWQRLTSSQPLGTPGYMSPQQQHGEEVDSRDDIYALGTVLYESLAGCLPKTGEDYLALNAIHPMIPLAIDDLVRSCRREEKSYRPPSAHEFWEKLADALPPFANFAKILVNGSLLDLKAVLSQMTAVDYARLPPGQQVLVLYKLKRLLENESRPLKNGVVSLLTDLIRLGYQSSRKQDYAFVIENALEYGYQSQAHESIHQALNEVAKFCPAAAHKIISEKLSLYLRQMPPKASYDSWICQIWLELLQSLLSNTTCTNERADLLVEDLGLVENWLRASKTEKLKNGN